MDSGGSAVFVWVVVSDAGCLFCIKFDQDQ